MRATGQLQSIKLHPIKLHPLVRQTIIFLISLIAIVVFSAFIALQAPGQTLSGSPDHYKAGIHKYKQGDFDGAISEFNKEMDNYLSRSNHFNAQGYANRTDKTPDSFVINYDNIVAIVSRQAAVYCSRGLAWYAKENLEEAQADFEQSINLAPQYLEAYLNLGVIKQLRYDPQGALEAYNQALKLNPKDVAIYFNRAVAYYSLKNADLAFADLDKVVEIEPKNAAVYLQRGNFWILIKEYDKALTDYNRAIYFNSRMASAYNNRGNIYFLTGKTAPAIADFERAIKLNPNLAEAYLNRGLLKLAEGKADEAEADFHKCRAMNAKLGTSIDERIKEIGNKNTITAFVSLSGKSQSKKPVLLRFLSVLDKEMYSHGKEIYVSNACSLQFDVSAVCDNTSSG